MEREDETRSNHVGRGHSHALNGLFGISTGFLLLVFFLTLFGFGFLLAKVRLPVSSSLSACTRACCFELAIQSESLPSMVKGAKASFPSRMGCL